MSLGMRPTTGRGIKGWTLTLEKDTETGLSGSRATRCSVAGGFLSESSVFNT